MKSHSTPVNGWPQFSVIIPCYNRRELIRPTLDSVLAQEETRYELIVVDDGSADGSADYIEREYPAARVIRQDNQGPGAARNAGARAACGEYLAFLDSDDLWFPWTLRVVSGVLDRVGGAAIIGMEAVTFERPDELDAVAAAAEEPVYDQWADLYAAAGPLGWMGSSVPIIRATDYAEVGGYPDERMNQEDVDLWMRLGTRERALYIRRPVLYARRVHPGNVSWDGRLDWIGADTLVRGERSGRYPGGGERTRDRQALLTAVLRATTVRMARRREWSRAMSIYTRSLRWNLHAGRWRYLLGFPLHLVITGIKRPQKRLGGRPREN